MESYYHGKSSGTDPLISYLNVPLRFKSNNDIDAVHNLQTDLNGYKIILIDSGHPRNGKDYISWFMEKAQDHKFKTDLITTLIPHTQTCIDSLIDGSQQSFIDAYFSLSEFQLNHFGKMIPAPIETLWKAGFNSGQLFLKICGAGGGGFFIGLLKENNKPNLLEGFKYYSLG